MSDTPQEARIKSLISEYQERISDYDTLVTAVQDKKKELRTEQFQLVKGHQEADTALKVKLHSDDLIELCHEVIRLYDVRQLCVQFISELKGLQNVG